jgi:putative acetyltransferase
LLSQRGGGLAAMPSSSSADSAPGEATGITLGPQEERARAHQAHSLRISPVTSHSDYAVARVLFEEYAVRLGVDLCFQGFSAELDVLDTMYGPPTGCLLLAWFEDAPVGCGAVRRLTETRCEMKRLYVRDSVRGRGCGRRLALEIIERARALGYGHMVLDTLEPMIEARRLYTSLGFRDCAPYYSNPLPGVRYLELNLR